MTQEPLTAEELQEIAHRLLKALDHIAEHDSRMTLGFVTTLLAVAAYNGPATPEEKRLSQTELRVAAQFRETKKAFSNNLLEFSDFTVKLPSGKTRNLSWVRMYQSHQDYRAKIPVLTPEGVRLVEAICRELRGPKKRRRDGD